MDTLKTLKKIMKSMEKQIEKKKKERIKKIKKVTNDLRNIVNVNNEEYRQTMKKYIEIWLKQDIRYIVPHTDEAFEDFFPKNLNDEKLKKQFSIYFLRFLESFIRNKKIFLENWNVIFEEKL